ncbi:gliding motility-associated C-terminal domain-containing protein, partial [Flavihumibacter sp. CACIAM 22H1]|uniref:gliding motility-associated C-terminal domain-containing protein n=1 Tax=Flavihumibacter sp. CACIAM 22H1 TaxID=1812911 RepID=UPI000B009E83
VDEGLSTQTAFCKTITVVGPPSSILGNDTSLCELSTLELRATELNGTQYQWSTGATTLVTSVNAAGKYWLDMVTRAGCVATDTILVNMAPSPVFSFGADTSICRNTSFTLRSPITADSYTWQNGTSLPQLEVNQTGRYYLTVQNGNCSFTDTLQVFSLPDPVLSLGIDPIICQDQAITLAPDNLGYPVYNWSTGASSASISITSPGLYWVEASNSFGCRYRDSVTVSRAIPLLVDLGVDQSLCEPATFVVNAPAGGDQYLWSTGATTTSLSIAQSGRYYVDIRKDGCTYSDTLTVLLKPSPQLTVSPDATLCPGEQITLTAATNAPLVNWSTGAVGSSLLVAAPGLYSVEAELDGCSTEQTISISRELPPELSLGPDRTICEGQAIQVIAVVNNGNFSNWMDGGVLPQRTISTTGQYIAWAENRCGLVSDTLLVRPGSDKETSYQLPNAFTPNGDGKNDCFGIQNWLIRDLQEFSIYNRFGQLIFSGTNSNKCWNGYFNGTLQENGGYVYVLRAETYCGVIHKKGIFLLIK